MTGEISGLSCSGWSGSVSGDILLGGDFSPGLLGPDQQNTVSDLNVQQISQKRRSPAAIARRKKQNRASQAAWRARNKELVEELRQEIAEHAEYNHSMQDTMRSLLKTTASLKSVIENVLALPSPKEARKGSCSERQLLTPESSVDTAGFEFDAPHDSIKDDGLTLGSGLDLEF